MTRTVTDPVGDTTIKSTGSELVMRIPAGRSHDLWTDDLVTFKYQDQAVQILGQQ